MQAMFFDIDGTILDSPRHRCVTDRVRRAVAAIRKRGVRAFIATARTWGQIPQDIRGMEFDGYVLASGSHLRVGGRDVSFHPLPATDVEALHARLLELGIDHALLADDFCYMTPNRRDLAAYYLPFGIDEAEFRYEWRRDDVLPRTVKVELLLDDWNDREGFRDLTTPFFYDEHPQGRSIEMCAAGRTKASGAAEILEHVGINPQDCWCFGDSINDMELFHLVGHPVAMGNAINELKAIAAQTCPHVGDDGVAVAIEQVLSS